MRKFLFLHFAPLIVKRGFIKPLALYPTLASGVACLMIGMVSVANAQTRIDYSTTISLVQEKARHFVREIDLSIKYIKSKNDSCDKRVIKLREKALEGADKVEFAAAELPLSHTPSSNPKIVPPGCEALTASAAVNKTRRAFSTLVSTVNSLVRTEKSCRTKYGLSYKPELEFINEVNRDLSKIPRKVNVCG